MSDNPLANTRAMIVLFAMDGCHACHDYKPRFEKQVNRFIGHGVPMVWYKPGSTIARHQIPVLIIDAASTDQSVTAFGDAYAIQALPSTLLLTHNGRPIKLDGAISDAELYQLLVAAVDASR